MKKGFTLIELLVVVLIIGILASVALPQYKKSVRRAEMVEGLTNGKTIYDSAIRYKSVNGVVPSSFNQIDVAFIGAEIDDNLFDDGNFTYLLNTDSVSAINNKGSYTLKMVYPLVTSTGVTAPIYCCPATDWVCANAAGTGAAVVNGCAEIK